MIEFKGNISEECKKYIWNRETKFVSLACIITALIFSGIVIIVALKVDLIIRSFAEKSLYVRGSQTGILPFRK